MIKKGIFSYCDLEKYFDRNLFAAVCGVKSGAAMTEEAFSALDSFFNEAVSYLLSPLSGPCVAEYAFEWFLCHREKDSVVSEDCSLHLPMLRQGGGERRSLCDIFPFRGESVPFGLFAIKVDAPDNGANPLIAHAARVSMAESASELLRRQFADERHCKVFMPAIGYPCCPDHSLKRDVLSRLDIDIKLTDSCAMIPEASICGLVICSDNFRLFEIKDLDPVELEDYALLRGFDETEKRLYLYSFLP